MHVRVSITASDLRVLTTRTRALVARACALRAQAATLRAELAQTAAPTAARPPSHAAVPRRVEWREAVVTPRADVADARHRRGAARGGATPCVPRGCAAPEPSHG